MVINKGNPTDRKISNTMLCTDDQVLMATSEDELQTMAYHLNLTARKYKMNLSSTKKNSLATCWNCIQVVKIVEQLSDFKYLRYLMLDYKSHLEDKLHTCNKLNGIIRAFFETG